MKVVLEDTQSTYILQSSTEKTYIKPASSSELVCTNEAINTTNIDYDRHQ